MSPPPPASTASLPPHIRASQVAAQYGRADWLVLPSSTYAGRSGGPGRPIPAGTLELPPAPTSVTQDEPENRTIALCNKTGGRCIMQGPKSKTHVLIVFKIVEGFKNYLAYINSIKHVKKTPVWGNLLIIMKEMS